MVQGLRAPAEDPGSILSIQMAVHSQLSLTLTPGDPKPSSGL